MYFSQRWSNHVLPHMILPLEHAQLVKPIKVVFYELVIADVKCRLDFLFYLWVEFDGFAEDVSYFHEFVLDLQTNVREICVSNILGLFVCA